MSAGIVLEVEEVFKGLAALREVSENSVRETLQGLVFPNSRTKKEWKTILHLISESNMQGSGMMANLAIENGALPKAKDYDLNASAHCVAQSNNFEVFKVLRATNADFLEKNKAGKSPKDIALDNDFIDMAMAMQDAMLFREMKRPYPELVVIGNEKAKHSYSKV